MHTVSPRDNLLRTLRRQGFDWVPVDEGWVSPAQVEAFRQRFGHDCMAEYFENPARNCLVEYETRYADPRALYPRETLPDDTDFDYLGVGHSNHPGCLHLTRMHHPLKGDVTADEIRDYPLPVITDTVETLSRRIHEVQAQGLAAKSGIACTLWEQSWYLRSMEDLMVDMMEDNERATILLDRILDFDLVRVRLLARSGVDILQTGDDIGMQSTPMMAPDLWRKWIKPRFAHIIREVRAIRPDILIWYHSCGFCLPFIDDLIEIGIDILNPVQPECMDFADIHKRYGDRLSFWSTVGTQRLLPFGTPDEVHAAVTRNIDLCGEQGGIVIGPTHMIEPEVPWENLEAMRLAAKNYRKK